MEKSLEAAWAGSACWVRSQNHQGGASSISQDNGELRFGTPLCKWIRVGWARQRSNGAFQCFVLERATLTPAAPQAPIPALEPRASQFVRDQVCARLLRGMPRIPAALCLTNLQSLPVFTARCYRDSFSLHWCLGLRSQVWGWDPLLLKGDLPIRDLSNHKGPAYSISPPLL